MYANQWQAMRGFSRDPSVTKQRLKPGTVRRIMGYARPYRLDLAVFMIAAALDAVVTVSYPILLGVIIDKGILPKRTGVVLTLAGVVAGLALFDAFLNIMQRYFNARVGEGLIYDLRTEVFSHVQRQPIAFFTRTQTGSLVSRLNSDVIGAQQALTSTLSSVVSSVLQLALVLAAMFYYSWLVTVISLVLLPMFLIPARLVGRRLQRLTRESMQLDAAMGSTMTERFNVAGAMLVKLFGRPDNESRVFAGRAARVRDIGVTQAMYGGTLFIALTLLASLATAVVYGVGGDLVIRGAFQVGALVALAGLLGRLYGPITSLSNVQVNVMTALVSFDRVFEVLDLKPLIADRPDAVPLPVAHRRGASASVVHPMPLRGTPPSTARRAPRSRSRRWSRLPCPRPSAPTPTWACCTTSASRLRPGSSPLWSGRPAQARRRSPAWCRGCTTRTRAPCASAGPTSGMSPRTRCTTWSASSRRTRTCSTTRSGPTWPTPGPAPPSKS